MGVLFLPPNIHSSSPSTCFPLKNYPVAHAQATQWLWGSISTPKIDTWYRPSQFQHCIPPAHGNSFKDEYATQPESMIYNKTFASRWVFWQSQEMKKKKLGPDDLSWCPGSSHTWSSNCFCIHELINSFFQLSQFELGFWLLNRNILSFYTQ